MRTEADWANFDDKGFVFYTNMESHKSHDLSENPHASLCFSWITLGQQVRISGGVEKVTDEEADAYYNSRPLISRNSKVGRVTSRWRWTVLGWTTFRRANSACGRSRR